MKNSFLKKFLTILVLTAFLLSMCFYVEGFREVSYGVDYGVGVIEQEEEEEETEVVEEEQQVTTTEVHQPVDTRLGGMQWIYILSILTFTTGIVLIVNGKSFFNK